LDYLTKKHPTLNDAKVRLQHAVQLKSPIRIAAEPTLAKQNNEMDNIQQGCLSVFEYKATNLEKVMANEASKKALSFERA
jgi:hypothetical protein